jgi:DNA-binding NtrC family response regulator
MLAAFVRRFLRGTKRETRKVERNAQRMATMARSHEATILLLDSDPVMRGALSDTFERAGYLVVSASDLGEAVDRLDEVRADLLITRPYINSMTGRTAADYLRSKRPGLPVLLVAGFLDDQRVNDQIAVERFHTFPPPFSREDLLAKVSHLLNALWNKAG